MREIGVQQFPWQSMMIAVSLYLFGGGCSSSKSVYSLGVVNGKLSDCPSSPNCVSTQTEAPDKKMSALPFKGDLVSSRNTLLAVLGKQKRIKIVIQQERYIHAEFRSALFRFVDDVEFYLDETAKLIHFRSASRTGYSDLGVNRKRMEEISTQYLSATNPI